MLHRFLSKDNNEENPQTKPNDEALLNSSYDEPALSLDKYSPTNFFNAFRVLWEYSNAYSESIPVYFGIINYASYCLTLDPNNKRFILATSNQYIYSAEEYLNSLNYVLAELNSAFNLYRAQIPALTDWVLQFDDIKPYTGGNEGDHLPFPDNSEYLPLQDKTEN